MRDFDVVLYGATGFTGRQCTQYFAQHAPAELRWAVAGRDRAKLERLAAGVPAFTASASDRASIDAFVGRTRIVLSTAGPFQLYSDAVVDACVRLRAHYVDITGETVWVRSLIERYHERAEAEGTRIIPFCGFDSAPADLGAAWIADEIGDPVEIKSYYTFKGGRPNGGTVASAFQIAASESPHRADDPFLLSPNAHRSPLPLEFDPTTARYDPDVHSWTAPFIMGPINTRVVRRSCALSGRDCEYQEYAKSRGALQAHVGAAAGRLMSRALHSEAGRRILKRLGPAPGTGPNEKAMDTGWFRCELFARSARGILRGAASCSGDPANRVTVKCVCESALALARDEKRLPVRAGVLTPSSGIGRVLQERLAQAPLPLTFDICPE